jgi:hypothetical protein
VPLERAAAIQAKGSKSNLRSDEPATVPKIPIAPSPRPTLIASRQRDRGVLGVGSPRTSTIKATEASESRQDEFYCCCRFQRRCEPCELEEPVGVPKPILPSRPTRPLHRRDRGVLNSGESKEAIGRSSNEIRKFRQGENSKDSTNGTARRLDSTVDKKIMWESQSPLQIQACPLTEAIECTS